MIRLLLIFIVLVPTHAQAAELTKTEIEAVDGRERVSFYLDTQLQPQKIFTLQNPPRLVVDFPKLTKAIPSKPRDYRGQMITSLRSGQFDADTTRIVADLTRPISILRQVAVRDDSARGWRIVVDIASDGAGQGMIVNDAPIPTLKPEDLAAEVNKPIIVIDAGHGGKDPGAKGRNVIEKYITLDYARHLRKALLRTGKYRVVMTREDDRYLLLRERVAIARNANGALFVSIHADSNPNKSASGFSVYTLSEDASDAETAALAERENKADIIGGMDLNEQDEEVASILIDLAQRETRNKSSRLAEDIIDVMHRKIPRLTNTHRYAGFRVLKAPDIPSVLVEVGFLSNAADERKMQTREYRDLVVEGLAKGIERYFHH